MDVCTTPSSPVCKRKRIKGRQKMSERKGSQREKKKRGQSGALCPRQRGKGKIKERGGYQDRMAVRRMQFVGYRQRVEGPFSEVRQVVATSAVDECSSSLPGVPPCAVLFFG